MIDRIQEYGTQAEFDAARLARLDVYKDRITRMERRAKRHEVIHRRSLAAATDLRMRMQAITNEHRKVIDTVARFFKVKSQELIGVTRRAPIAESRRICYYLLRQMTMASFAEIGLIMGDRDHSTVLHGVQTVSADIENDQILNAQIELLKKLINSAEIKAVGA